MELIASGRLKTTTGEAFNFLTVSIDLGGCATQLDIVRKIGRGLKASLATNETIQRVAKASWDWLTNWEVLGVRFHKDEAELDPEEVSEELVQKLAQLCNAASSEIEGVFLLIDEADGPSSEAGLGALLKFASAHLQDRRSKMAT